MKRTLELMPKGAAGKAVVLKDSAGLQVLDDPDEQPEGWLRLDARR